MSLLQEARDNPIDPTEELEKILAELEDTNLELDETQLMEYKRKLNPYGRTIEGSDNYLTFSFTNLREEYLKKLLMTSFIGYLNRACDEWHVPDDLPVIPVYDYVKEPSKLQEFHKGWKMTPKLEKQIKENEEWMAKRVIVKEFLEEMFQYNPDMHVRSVYKPNPKDPERKLIKTPAANLAVEKLKSKDALFKEKMLEHNRTLQLMNMSQSVIEFKNAEEGDPKPYSNPILNKLVSEKNMVDDNMKDDDLPKSVYEMIPPDDIFYKFRNYMEDNYDIIREAVNHLYCEKPEFDLAINPYQWHESEDDAMRFMKKHRNEVIMEIYKAHSGKWNLFAPFNQVRETMRYFNDKTEVLEQIMEQREQDSKLGQDMMKKRVLIKKKKNIEEEGADDEAFLKWKEKNTVLKDMGAESINAGDYADDECPDDAVQVDVFRVSGKTGKMDKTKFYTQADDYSRDEIDE